ncbi:MAG: NAD(P)/FAD-dependent oxidoreductase [Lachnospiraceae bacterium]|nr:NAD(P)/FAD-dependent oxidoreductase [Lachnospiraceae bacterium]MBP3477704.1 NAD(P)/FAD-dependent oxidoreductase [Lachnospiraceae bacterium]
MSNVVVVGGGAAGMMAAIAAAEQGHCVTLMEQNEKLGKKIYITGKGRCNVTNACETDKLFENIVSNPKFLYSAFYDYTNVQVMDMLKEAGCSLKIERGERVFPVSDHASDIIAALERTLKQKGVIIRLGTVVKDILAENDHVTGVKLKNNQKVDADAVVIATGGLSYPTTGATGDGYRMAEALGHTVKECIPALVPMEIAEEWCKDLQGLSLKNVTLTMLCGKKQIYQGFGEMLFTHFGISGPLVLSASSYYGRCKDKSQVSVTVDLKPALSEEQLDKRILRDFEQNLNKQFKNVIGSLYPAKLTPVMIELSGIDGDKKIHEITKEERKRLLAVTKQLTMKVSGLRDFHEAIITQGGIHVKEINPSTMESKLVNGLYFAGEILDLDALTGGFNLQIAWSTGHLAGSSIDG